MVNSMEKELQTQRETFVASVGHDLKNPTLAQIRVLELLLKGDFGLVNPDQKELLEMLLESCRYMNGMLSSLLETYRSYNGTVHLKFSEISFDNLVKECLSEMIYVAKDKNISVDFVSNNNDRLIFADRVQLKRVIMNLLTNAIKYGYKNSMIKLSVTNNDSKISFQFENNSPYIPKEKQKALFNRYVSYSTINKGLGTGLGLYASKKIIDAHNGKIYLESFKDDRNIFGFTIPVKPNDKNVSISF